MKRREFIASRAATWPLRLSAQEERERMPRIGVLMGRSRRGTGNHGAVAESRRGLDKPGPSEGRILRIDTRVAVAHRVEQAQVPAKAEYPETLLMKTYANADFEQIAIAIDVEVEQIAKHEYRFEAAALWCRLDQKRPSRIAPSKAT